VTRAILERPPHAGTQPGPRDSRAAELARARTLVAVSEDDADQRPERQLTPLDLPMVPFVIGGMVVWLVIGLVLLGFRDSLVAHGREAWLTICLTGFLVGLPGLALMIVHDRNRRIRRNRPADR
jgi:hypothetical protein